MNEFLKILLGDMDLPTFLGYYAMAFLSAFLMLIIRADKKRKTSKDTPVRFDWGFFLQDNILKFLINILTIGFAIRFCNEFMGSEITGWLSFLIGIGLNELTVRIQNFESKARE